MKKIIRRLIYSFIIIYVINFFVPRLIPGDPFSHSASSDGQEMTGLNAKELEKMKAYYGLDKPLKEQFTNTIRANLKGDFGDSILYKKPVKEVIKARLPWTIYLMFLSLILSLILSIILASLSVSKPGLGRVIEKIAIFIAEIPSFVIGIFLLFMLAAKVDWIPLSGNLTAFSQYESSWEYIKDLLAHSLMPVLTLLLLNTPVFYFTLKTSLENTKDKTYVVAARTRGIKESRVRLKYIVLNGLIPLIIQFFMSFGNVLSATIIVENIFAYPGIGRTMREAVLARDLILIQGVFLVSTIIVLTSSFISELFTEHFRKYN